MTPAELLAEADRLLTSVVPGTRGRWPRACAWLTRLALEQALDEYWSRTLLEAVTRVGPRFGCEPYRGPLTSAFVAGED